MLNFFSNLSALWPLLGRKTPHDLQQNTKVSPITSSCLPVHTQQQRQPSGWPKAVFTSFLLAGICNGIDILSSNIYSGDFFRLSGLTFYSFTGSCISYFLISKGLSWSFSGDLRLVRCKNPLSRRSLSSSLSSSSIAPGKRA